MNMVSKRSHFVQRRMDREQRQLDRWLEGEEPNPTQLGCAAWFAEVVLGNHDLATKLFNKGAEILPIQRAQGIGIDTQGGFLVPQVITDQIIEYRQAASVVRRNATTWSITRGDRMDVPKRTTGVTVSFMGEGSTLSSSDLTFDSITLTPRKLGGFVKLSTEVETDSSLDWTNYLLQELGNALGLSEDGCGLQGDGTETFGGMRGVCTLLVNGEHDASKVAASGGAKTALTLLSADIAALMAALPEQYWPGAKFFCSGYFYANGLARLAGAVGGIIVDDNSLPTYGGIPIVITPKMVGAGDQTGNVMLIFGDMSRAVVLGSGRELSMATSRQRFADVDQVAVRCTERIHIVAHGLGDGTSAGALVGLIGTA